ncbi:hypothetical protein [Nannocystis sp.]|uniref:hypothetical protein n=1 Tax=Nannocystis sp. TaxID=1962667 RepID=UPI0025E060C3|nr:hypothetical protein [Nannocystis sp.]MBK7827362.1 hypothetical protein [Nannocystis sp.]
MLAAEVLEAGPHADEQRTRVWSLADAALARLPDAHPLRLRLQRDLGYIALAHARHVTPEGTCTGDAVDFQRCGELFTATRRLAAIARDPAAMATDHELLARAHRWAGNEAAAAVARAGADPQPLVESGLGYLDFSRAEVVAPTPSLADHVRCNADLSVCEVDRAFVTAAGMFADMRIMDSVADGVTRGPKLYAITPDSPFSILGLKNGDLVVDLAGTPIEASNFLPSFERFIAAGGGTIRIERKGEAIERRFIVK